MKGRSMQLGGAKKGNTIPGIDPWGNGDLMDVNADEGDWTAFESAPSTLGFDQVTTPSFAIDGQCPLNLILSWVELTYVSRSRCLGSSGRHSE